MTLDLTQRNHLVISQARFIAGQRLAVEPTGGPPMYRAADPTFERLQEWELSDPPVLVRDQAMPVSARPFDLRCITYDPTRDLIWALDAGSIAGEALVSIDPATFAHQDLLPVPESGGAYFDGDVDYHAGDDWIWMTGYNDGDTIYALDPADNGNIVSFFAAPGNCFGIARGAGTDLWVGNTVNGELHRMSTATGAVLNTYALGGTPDPFYLWYDPGPNELWISDHVDDVLHVYDLGTVTPVRTVDLSSSPHGTTGFVLP